MKIKIYNEVGETAVEMLYDKLWESLFPKKTMLEPAEHKLLQDHWESVCDKLYDWFKSGYEIEIDTEAKTQTIKWKG